MALTQPALPPVSTAPDHPWISFTCNLTRIPHETWVLLGECSSKIEHVAGAPLRPATQNKLNKTYLAKGAQATTAIEGNTLTEEQVNAAIEGQLTLPQSQQYLADEINNVLAGFNHIIEQIVQGAPLRITPDDLKLMNRLVLAGLEVEPGVVPGQFRTYTVTVGGYRSPPAEYNASLVAQLCEWMNEPVWHDRLIGSRFVLPILKAVLAHLYIAWIHPFGDGNGRTARLVEFDILTRAGVPTVSAHLLSTHYNLTRAAYYRALNAARTNVMDFITYAVRGFVDGLRDQIAVVESEQLDVAWRDYVYKAFDQEAPTPARDRRRELVFALTEAGATPFTKLPLLTPSLAVHYDGTDRMLARDLNLVSKLLLVRRTQRGWVANTDMMRAFLPLVHDPQPDDEDDPEQIGFDLSPDESADAE